MNDALYAALARMPARQLRLLAAGVVAIAAMGTWTLAVRAPWMTLRAAQVRLAATPATPAASTATLRAPASALTQLERAAAALGQIDLKPGLAANGREAKVHVALYLPAVQP